MAPSAYQIADTDELEVFGREDDPELGTSAGLGPNDPVNVVEGMPSSSKRKWCVCAVFTALSLAAIVAFVAVLFGARPLNSNGTTPDEPLDPNKDLPTFTVSVVSKTKHDEKAFIQGFEYSDGVFYESTGLRGRSTLRKVEIESGKVLQEYKLEDNSLFGEGITLYRDKHIYMLTWEAGRGIIFNQSTFEVIKEWKYDGEGWGLAFDESAGEIYMSDGTTQLRVLEPDTLNEKRRVNVTLKGSPVNNLNELEWICGEVWANVWLTKNIYRIDPKTGIVKSIITARNLPENDDRYSGMDVLNGIAFDKETGRLWLTGKLWRAIYRVTISDTSLNLRRCK